MRKSTGLEPMNNDKNSQAKDLNKTLGLAINENLKFKEARYAESTIGPYRRKSKQLVTWFGKGRCEQVPDMRSCLSSGAMEQGSS